MVAHSGDALLKGRHAVWVNVLAPHWYYPERTSNAMRTTQSQQEAERC